MTRSLALRIVALWVAAATVACASPPRPADAVYVSGRIYTVVPERLWVEALAIRDGIILAVGPNREVLAKIDQGTRIVDLEGAMVIPAPYDPNDRELVVGAFSLHGRRAPWIAMEEQRTGEGAADMATVLRAFTIDEARARGEDDRYGTIERGKRASFVVLDQNLFDVPPADIGDTRVVESVIAGETVREGR